MTPTTSALLRAGAALGAIGAVTGGVSLAWALHEAHLFTLREADVPALPPGSPQIRLLHLSDLHITPEQTDKAAWVADLARLSPDLVVVTGDFLGHQKAVPFVLEALAPLLSRPGAFVLGSNDFFGPRRVNPLGYLTGPSRIRRRRPFLPWGDLVSGLRRSGWSDLNNRVGSLEIAGLRVEARGVNDPHIGLDHYSSVAGPFPPEADLRLGVAHAPYLRVLDAMAADGADLILAGHTHGGQVCLPGGRALVTNCDLDTTRARGLSSHRPGQRRLRETGNEPPQGQPGDVGGIAARGLTHCSYLHVSAGLGTAPSAPIRFFCRPEATLLTLVGRD